MKVFITQNDEIKLGTVIQQDEFHFLVETKDQNQNWIKEKWRKENCQILGYNQNDRIFDLVLEGTCGGALTIRQLLGPDIDNGNVFVDYGSFGTPIKIKTLTEDEANIIFEHWKNHNMSAMMYKSTRFLKKT